MPIASALIGVQDTTVYSHSHTFISLLFEEYSEVTLTAPTMLDRAGHSLYCLNDIDQSTVAIL